MEFTLIRHPLSPAPPIDSICVDVSRPADDRIVLHYRIFGDISEITMPALIPAERADELWTTTCFEAFCRMAGRERYVEYNFSPSTRWAGYIFDSYRTGRQDFSNSTLPRIDVVVGKDSFELTATVNITGNEASWRSSNLELGLSAVIETRDRQKSYWALAHPPGAPDFHHGDCFAGILRAPDEA